MIIVYLARSNTVSVVDNRFHLNWDKILEVSNSSIKYVI